MTLDAELSQSQEERLQEVLAAYLRDVEAGRNPDRAELLARHPELAGELQSFFAGQEQIGRLAAPLRQAVEPSADVGISGTLGDFRIVREVGRGGMGIVYEAEQISLRRRVALKVLPFAATMDPRHLQRFHNEAQAAACLHHTNIVPVYFVGSERGVHFYAMQFIDGQPLSEIIRQMRRLEKKEPLAAENGTVAYQASSGDAASTPPAAEMTPLTGEGRRNRDYYRKVAELGIQAAEALDHAHQLGIVHRDIKPGNLMLDGMGRVWVTDFGLAHMQHGEASLTGTGQMVGTPRYMSPEQAMAKRVPIDHRTDVYSLGVTLYELLTLRPAFGSEDRQELLRQIAFEEPTKPRRLERAVPAELETIVLKAMEKRPQDRYATAQELADDLRHWLDDRPIRARRPSWVQVGRKWARRHQSAIGAASLLLFILMIVGFVNAMWWVQQKTAAEIEAAKKLTEAETEARAALQEAERWQGEERWSEALSAIRRAQAVLRGFGSDANLRQQLDELTKDLEMAQQLEEAQLQYTTVKDENFDHEACAAIYADAFAWYGLDVEHGDTGTVAEFIRLRSISMQLVAALDQWTNVQRMRKGQEWKHLLAVARAADGYRWRNQLRDAWERGVSKAMNDLFASAEVEDLLPATSHLLRFSVENEKNVSIDRAVTLLERAQQRRPADFWINHHLAMLLWKKTQPPQLEEAIRHFMIAVALRPRSPGAHLNLGGALKDKGRLDEAIAEYREAIRIKKNFAEAHNSLGAILCDGKGDYDSAIAEFQEAIHLKKDHAEAHYNLGNALQHKGRLDEAIVEYREAIHLKEDHAQAHCNLARALKDKGQFIEALRYVRRGHELGANNPRWSYPSAQWVQICERLVELDSKLPAIQSGQKQPADNAERLALAGLCQIPCKKQYLVAMRFYTTAFAEEPKLAENLDAEHRYNAACAAALAGCGQGADADKLDTKERARLRHQALDWLRSDLKAYRQVMEKSAGKAGPMIAQRMQHWLQDGDFAGVRGDNALAKLPEEERPAWRKLWADVAEMLAKAQGKASAEKKADTK
jgi:serine/threonine protein kinase